jgi:hypothetical protein
MSKQPVRIGFEPPLGKAARRSMAADGRKKSGGRRSPPGGRPRWNPQEQIREAVFKAASRGVSQDLIAELVGVSESTLKRNCSNELRLGAQMAYAKIAMAAFEMALSGDHPQMTRWWLQVRAGWKRAK